MYCVFHFAFCMLRFACCALSNALGVLCCSFCVLHFVFCVSRFTFCTLVFWTRLARMFVSDDAPLRSKLPQGPSRYLSLEFDPASIFWPKLSNQELTRGYVEPGVGGGVLTGPPGELWHGTGIARA